MKIILTQILLFIFCFVGAQNNDIKTMFKIDSLSIQSKAEELVKIAKLDYEFYKVGTERSTSSYYYIYVDKSLTNEAKSQIDRFCDKCIMVIFKKEYVGRNIDLEQEGTPVYRFAGISRLKYLNAYNLMQHYFYPDKTANEVLEDEKFQEYFVPNDIIAGIRKMRDRWYFTASPHSYDN